MESKSLNVAWEVKKVGDVFDFLKTASYSRDMLSQIDDVSYIHYGDIHTKFSSILDFEQQMIPSIPIELSKGYSLLQNGDIIMADASEDYGGVGKSVEVYNIGDRKAISGLHTILLREKSSKYAAKFKGYLFQSIFVKSQLDKLATGLKVYSISKSILKDIEIPLPPLPEQRRIAEVLSDMDGLIGSLEKLLAKKRMIRQGMMQRLLTPQPDWEVKRLGEIVEILDNLRVPLNSSQREKMKGDIPYCGANGVVDYVNDFVIDDDIFLIAEDGGYFDEYSTRPIAYKISGKCWVNNHVHILKAKTEYHQDFIYFSIVHKNILDYINGGTRAKLNKGELVSIEVSVPNNKQEQISIAKMLSNIDQEIDALQAKQSKIKLIKQGMMQKLLTGEIRLLDA